ncbi:sigma-70 family RNA polymerase sigma factor [Isoptericola halotolerans]|uniref:sigma-70 family RNA polymerase sigma factor n=1 Tax=Isoptericola halotolerans TaxID=300560 RepID=UPI003890AD19
MPDGRLTTLAREGRDDAYAELYRRHHAAALRYARRFVPAPDAHDVAQEAFLNVLRALRGEHGPRDEFVGYLLRTVRNLVTDRSRRTESVLMELQEIEDAQGEHSPDHAHALAERDVLARAFASLPDQWQRILWLTEVEGTPPRDLVPQFASSPNAVAQLSRRAREGLRGAWLQAHVRTRDAEPGCRETLAVLADYDRGRLGASKARRVDAHLVGCASCSEVLAELRHVSLRMPVLLLPVVLGAGSFVDGAFAGTSGTSGAGAGVGAGAASRGSRRRAHDRGLTTTGIAAGAVGVVVVAAVVVGATVLWGTGSSPGSSVAGTGAVAAPAAPVAPERAEPVSPSPSPSSSDQPEPSPEPPLLPDPHAAPAVPDEAEAAEPAAAPVPGASDPPAADAAEPTPGAPPQATPAPTSTPSATPSPSPSPSTAPTPSPSATPTPTPSPSATPTPTPDPPTITAPAAGDFRTSVTLTGTALPGATVEVVDQGGVVVATATADAVGAWEAVPEPGEPDVATTYTATQTVDAARSGASGAAGPYVFEAPVILAPVPGEDVSVLPGNLVAFDLHVPAGTPYEVTLDGGTTSFPALETDTTFNYFFADLDAGSHELTTRFVDPSGAGAGALRRVTFFVPSG